MNRLFVLAGLAAILLIAGCLGPEKNTPSPNLPPSGSRAAPLYTFSSWDEISDLLRLSSGSGFGGAAPVRDMRLTVGAVGEITSASPAQKESAERYSQTNVQVEGVDEADIVKNDGKYIYAVYNRYSDFGIGSVWFYGAFGKVAIVEAYPPEKMKKVGQISIEDASVHEIFVSKDKLVVFGQKESQYFRPMPVVGCRRCILPPIYYQPLSFVRVYDISDKAAPKLEKEIEVKGEYFDSRMIQNKVYAIFRDYPTYYDPVPFYRIDGAEKKVEPQEIAYFDMPSTNYVYHHFFEIDLQNLQAEKRHKIVMLGYGQTLYVSSENIYLASTEYRFYSPEEEVTLELIYEMLPAQEKEEIDKIEKQNTSSWQRQLAKREAIIAAGKKIMLQMNESETKRFVERYEGRMKNAAREWRSESTKIYKISLSGFEPVAWGEVPGSLINQFAMDESGQYLRVATTKNAPVSSSGVYVLDGGLKVVGKTEGIAPGESIYSVRFAGNKVYLVTFKKIDPFFVIDVSNPNEPKVEGKLKIPGYSTYLHPYDEKHVIGIGKEAVEAKEGDFAWQQGVKLSLFEVSNPENPIEVAKFQIGDRGTESYALTDHKAFLFDKERGLLVIPVLVAEIDERRYGGEVPPHAYGDYVFQGAYVFEVSPTKGFVLLGRISHASQEEFLKSGSYFISDAEVKRSLYMDDYLYTVSDKMIKANRLPSLEEVAEVQLQKS